MKSVQKLVKYNLKFVPILLALIISYIIIMNFCSENSIISTKELSLAPINDKAINNSNKDSLTMRVTSILLKCSLAFLFGGWVSDRKFIFFGAI